MDENYLGRLGNNSEALRKIRDDIVMKLHVDIEQSYNTFKNTKHDDRTYTRAAMVVKPRFSRGNYNARINNNDFVWDLIEFGFTATDTQNSNRISSMVPIQKMNDYKAGFNL